MAQIGSVSCPEIVGTGSGESASVPVLCGELADVVEDAGVITSTCPQGHIHALSERFVQEFVARV